MARSDAPPVPLALRLLNVLALLLFLAGAGFHLRSWFGMRALRSYEVDPEAPLLAGMAQFDHYWELSRVGTWLVWAAVGVGVAAALALVVIRRRTSPGSG